MSYNKFLSKYGYILFSVVVIVTWGLVPLFAKLGSLPGGQTTMWVNWFAVIAVLVIMALTNNLKQIRKGLPYKTYVKIGFIWPLVYSIAYFSAVDKGGPSLTTIANYTWPVFALALSYIMLKEKSSGKDWIVVVFAAMAVGIPVFLEGKVNLLLWPLIFGLVAAASQAYFNISTHDFGADTAWVLTLVISIVTAVGSTIYVVIFEKFELPGITTLGYLAFIGSISNGIGFWAFLRAGQAARALGKKSNTIFLVLMCLTPLAQALVLLVPFWKVESVSPLRWVGIILITLSVCLYHFLPEKKNENM